MGDINSAGVIGFSIAVIFLILATAWVMWNVRNWMQNRRDREFLESGTLDLEAAALSGPSISRPFRLLPAGQTFTIVRNPLPTNALLELDAKFTTSSAPRVKRSASMPSSYPRAPQRKRTIVWFDELGRKISDTSITEPQLQSGSSLLDSSSDASSDSQSDSSSVRSGRSHSFSVLPNPRYLLPNLSRENSLSSVSKLWLTYQANQF